MNLTQQECRQIAQNILGQISTGVKMRLGMREIAFDGPSLRFRIGPSRGTKKVVVITLTPDDLYTVECKELRGSLRGGTLRVETTFSEGTDDHGGIYCDMLDDSLLRLEKKILA